MNPASTNRIYIVYYDGQPYDHVQSEGRSSYRWKQPKRIYWTLGHAKAALRGIIDCLPTESSCKASIGEPVRDPSKFEIRVFDLVPVEGGVS